MLVSYVEQNVRQRIEGWSKRFLPWAGKEVLLKSVAQAMPTLTMSVYLMSISLCERLERCMNKYWWDNESGGGIHWLTWDRMSMAEVVGGLGFKQLHNFNLALLGKQGWLLLTNPTTLVARIFQARYYPKSSFMEATVGHNLAIVGEVSMMLISSPKQEPVGDLVMGIPRVFGVNLGYWIRRTLLFQQKCLCHFIKH